MNWQLTPYVLVLGMATALSLYIAAQGLRYRDRPGGMPLFGLMLAVASWSFLYILEASSTTIALKVRWSQLAYIGTLAAGPLYLRLALDVTQQSRRWRGALLWLVWSIPAISLLLVFTNGAHGLIWRGFTFSPDSRHILIYERGPWFGPMVAHAHGVLLGTMVLLIITATRYRPDRANDIFQRQILLVLLAAAPPWILSLLYLVRSGVLGGREWTPAGFALTGLIILWNIEGLRFIDLVPVARDRIIASLDDAVIVVDHQGRIVDVNPAAERLLGSSNLVGTEARISLAYWLGTPVPGDPAGMMLNGKTGAVRTLADFLPPQGELVTANGTLEWRVTPLEAGGVPGHIILLHDVTTRKQTEAALQSLNATLEFRIAERTAQILAEKERGEAILYSISDGILMTDRDLYILYANPTFTDLSGYDAEEVLGCPISEVLGGEIAVLLRDRRLRGSPYHGELALPHKDGRMMNVAVNISPVKCHAQPPQHGGVSGYVCSLRNITSLKNLERARKSFIDNISHQLRTPVTNLRLYAHLMEQGELSEQSRIYLQVMQKQTAWLQHLIEDILEMTSLDSGQAISQWAAVAPATVIDHIATRYESQAKHAGLHLSWHMPAESSPSLRGDEMRLIQAMSEIADNAIRFTPAGGEVIVRLETVEDDTGRLWVVFSIADTGPGIPQEEQPRIFDRFFRGALTESGQLSGTGLGLSIAEAIVVAHGGQITLETGPGGTTVKVWLPAAPVAAAASSR
jgi:two-component system, OmpR family, phosphate regulon sensor histidine kinase PhoR